MLTQPQGVGAKGGMDGCLDAYTAGAKWGGGTQLKCGDTKRGILFMKWTSSVWSHFSSYT